MFIEDTSKRQVTHNTITDKWRLSYTLTLGTLVYPDMCDYDSEPTEEEISNRIISVSQTLTKNTSIFWDLDTIKEELKTILIGAIKQNSAITSLELIGYVEATHGIIYRAVAEMMVIKYTQNLIILGMVNPASDSFDDLFIAIRDLITVLTIEQLTEMFGGK